MQGRQEKGRTGGPFGIFWVGERSNYGDSNPNHFISGSSFCQQAPAFELFDIT